MSTTPKLKIWRRLAIFTKCNNKNRKAGITWFATKMIVCTSLMINRWALMNQSTIRTLNSEIKGLHQLIKIKSVLINQEPMILIQAFISRLHKAWGILSRFVKWTRQMTQTQWLISDLIFQAWGIIIFTSKHIQTAISNSKVPQLIHSIQTSARIKLLQLLRKKEWNQWIINKLTHQINAKSSKKNRYPHNLNQPNVRL